MLLVCLSCSPYYLAIHDLVVQQCGDGEGRGKQTVMLSRQSGAIFALFNLGMMSQTGITQYNKPQILAESQSSSRF